MSTELDEEQLHALVVAGIKRAQARSAARLAELGVDSDELGVWVAERVALGAWPDGDLLAAFRAWSQSKAR